MRNKELNERRKVGHKQLLPDLLDGYMKIRYKDVQQRMVTFIGKNCNWEYMQNFVLQRQMNNGMNSGDVKGYRMNWRGTLRQHKSAICVEWMTVNVGRMLEMQKSLNISKHVGSQITGGKELQRGSTVTKTAFNLGLSKIATSNSCLHRWLWSNGCEVTLLWSSHMARRIDRRIYSKRSKVWKLICQWT